MTDNGQYETFFEILRTDFSEFYNPSENWAVDSHCEIRGKSSIQAVHKKNFLSSKCTECVAPLAMLHVFSEGCDTIEVKVQ